MKTKIVNFKNKKNGKTYKACLMYNVLNKTNKNNGEEMILYTDGNNLFVRETTEFYKNFEKI